MKIIYEDKDILVVHKEAGLPVQSRSALTQDLESMLLADFIKKNKGQQKPELHVINRLDQPVEGLVLFAKNKKAAAGLTPSERRAHQHKQSRRSGNSQIKAGCAFL